MPSNSKTSANYLNFRTLLRYALKGAALAAIVTAVILCFTMGPETWKNLREFPLPYLPLLFFLVFLAWASLGGRIWVNCHALGYRVRYRQALATAISMEFGVAASPAGVGGVAIRLALLRKAGVPLAASSTLFGADTLIDILFFTLVTPLALWVLLSDPAWRDVLHFSEQGPLVVIAVVLLTGIAVVCALILRGEQLSNGMIRMSSRSRRATKMRLPARIRAARMQLRRELDSAVHSAKFLYRRGRWALFANFLLAMIQWSCRYGILPLLLLAFHSTRNPLPLMMLQGLLFMASIALVLPGGGGGVELLSVIILPLFLPKNLIGIVLFLWRFFTYYLYLIGGGAVFFWVLHHIDRIFAKDVKHCSARGC